MEGEREVGLVGVTAVLKQRLAGWSKRDEEGREGRKEF